MKSVVRRSFAVMARAASMAATVEAYSLEANRLRTDGLTHSIHWRLADESNEYSMFDVARLFNPSSSYSVENSSSQSYVTTSCESSSLVERISTVLLISSNTNEALNSFLTSSMKV